MRQWPPNADFYGVDDEPGEVVVALANTNVYPFPKLDMLALIGLTTRRDSNSSIIDPGDALITFQGQRFLPSDSAGNTADIACQASELPLDTVGLRVAEPIGKARVFERILEFPDDTLPGDGNPDLSSGGYRHSMKVWTGHDEPPAEAHVSCVSERHLRSSQLVGSEEMAAVAATPPSYIPAQRHRHHHLQ